MDVDYPNTYDVPQTLDTKSPPISWSETLKPSRTAPRGAWPLMACIGRVAVGAHEGSEGLCAAGRRSRSVRRLVTNPICGSISGSRSTRSSRRLERSSDLVPFIRSRAISTHAPSSRFEDRAREIVRDRFGGYRSSQGHIRANDRVECVP